MNGRRACAPRPPSWRAELSLEFLAGLPTDELQQHLRELQRESIVFTPGFFRDGSGRQFSPREASAAHRSRILGAGLRAVFDIHRHRHRRRPHGELQRHRAPRRADRARAARWRCPGLADPAAAMPAPLHLDWRQLRRWGIAPQAIPADAIVHFKEPTLWEAYRQLVLIAGVVMLLQAGLIVALLLERRRRGAPQPRWPGASNTCVSRPARPACRPGSLTAAPYSRAASSPPRHMPTRVRIRSRTSAQTLAHVHPQDRDVVETATA